MKKKDKFFILYNVFFITLFLSVKVYGYIDPATTSYIIQIVAALFITLGVFLSAFKIRIKTYILKLKMEIIEEQILRKEVKKNPTTENKSKIKSKESSKAHILLVALPIVSIFFAIIVFVPVDTYIYNNMYFDFIIHDFLWVSLIAFMLISFIMAYALTKTKGNLFEILVCLLTGISIGFFLQYNFLNSNIGLLNGDRETFRSSLNKPILNLAIWMFIILTLFIIRYFSKIIWRIICIVLPGILFTIQIFTIIILLSTSLNSYNNRIIFEKHNTRHLSIDGYNELSSNENIILFVLDTLDQEYIDMILEEDPDYFHDFDGFTEYTNNITNYSRTYPSVVSMLTGEYTRYDETGLEFMNRAYKNFDMATDLRNNNYSTKFYMTAGYTYRTIDQIENFADNIVEFSIISDKIAIMKTFLKLSFFLQSPNVFKDMFWISTEDFSGNISADSSVQPYIVDDVKFYSYLTNKKLKTTLEDKNNFVYYHLRGSHIPYRLDENLKIISGETNDPIPQTKGSLKIVQEYLSQLKELGLYENSTIIVTGDHGSTLIEVDGGRQYNELDDAVLTALFVKPKNSSGTPLKTNDAPVCPDNLRATIIKGAGIEDDSYGPTYWEVPEDADAKRKYYHELTNSDGTSIGFEEFEINGHANDFNNWKRIGNFEIKSSW